MSGYFRDHDVRKQMYRSVFAGACGVTYGHHAIWQFADERHGYINYADRPWYEALDRPAARQVKYLRALIESRPYLSRIPDQTLLLSDPGIGGQHIRATRDAEGRYALVYLPLPLPVTVNLEVTAGTRVNAWWYAPCTGEATWIGQFPANGMQTFSPPGQHPDWVLVLDDAALGFGAPGQ